MRTRPPDDPQATNRVTPFRNIMKSYQRITLFATVLATVAIPSLLRGQAPAVEGKDTPASERQLELNNAEREALRKVYQSAVEEMHKAKDEMRTNAEKSNDIGTYIRSMQWVVQVESRLRKFQPSDATKVAALKKRLDEIFIDHASVGDIVFQCEILATQDKGIPFDNGINIVLMHTGKTPETYRELDYKPSLHDYLKALAKEAGLVVHIGEDVVSLRHPKDAEISEAAPDKPKDEEKDEELAFYEKTYGKKIPGVSPKSKYDNPDEFYSDIAEQLGLLEIISKAADAKFGSKEENGAEFRTLARVRPSATAGKPGWDIVMPCYTPKPKHEKVDSAKKAMVQLLHLDFEGNVTFLKRFPSSE